MWSGFTGSLAFRANFFWMFFSVEVPHILTRSSEQYTNADILKLLMRGFSSLDGMPYAVSRAKCTPNFIAHIADPDMEQMSTGTANFFSGGLASFVFWGMGIPADNVKK